MSNHTSRQVLYDATSYTIPISNYDTYGLCRKYPLRRHKWEAEANAGCHEARLDWVRYVGPIDDFGLANPINGNLVALALPLAKPERLRLVSYVFEYTFYYDGVLDLPQLDATIQPKHDHHNQTDPALGMAQIEAKILTQLTSVDRACGERVMRTMREWDSTAMSNKGKQFGSLQEYLDFRVSDLAGPFSEALALFAMGMTLTEQEDAQLEPIRRPWYRALTLANDYFSFDREYLELMELKEMKTIKNSVWLHMQWHGVDVAIAKKMVLSTIRQYEDQFVEKCTIYRQESNTLTEKLSLHLDVLAFMVSGNMVWNLNCPRYHPDKRYNPDAGLEDELTANWMRQETLGIDYEVHLVHKVKEDLCSPSIMDLDSKRGHLRNSPNETCLTTSDESGLEADGNISHSSRTSVSSSHEVEQITAIHPPKRELLNSRHAKAPVDYINSLPSGGARDIFINALAIWLKVSTSTLSRIKSIGNRLHSASLILDDIEDGSSLRRGEPAAHTVFGTAQTLNSGCYEFVRAVEEARQLGPEAVKIVLEGLDELHIGQSYDLYWTQNCLCPTKDEYLEMVSKKTGGMFRLIARLLLGYSASKALSKDLITNIEDLVSLIGIQYQIRDDYQNLYCKEYSEKKGFCQDLDEGKFSFPLIHALSVELDGTKLLRELLQRRRDRGYLSYEQKRLVLKQLDCAGSMTYTHETLKRLEGEINQGVKRIEGAIKIENWILRALLQKLEV